MTNGGRQRGSCAACSLQGAGESSRPNEEGYVQLELSPTVTGPRRRTEDPLEPGTEVRIKGEQGTFTYRYATVSRAGMVSLHLMGTHGFRAVRPEQVVAVRKRRRGGDGGAR